jgi:peptide-methionine (S)-S-oxide reductase
MEVAIFGGGCFWCTEAIFSAIAGVESVEPGYCGGDLDNPSYEQVCSMETGHIEVVRVTFDPDRVSYQTLLEVFFATHDPTTPGRQGNDVGPQYESVIFAQNDSQRVAAQNTIDHLNREKSFASPIVTQIRASMPFWMAEAYHQDFYQRNPAQGYCQFIIDPKMKKLGQRFAKILRTH